MIRPTHDTGRSRFKIAHNLHRNHNNYHGQQICHKQLWRNSLRVPINQLFYCRPSPSRQGQLAGCGTAVSACAVADCTITSAHARTAPLTSPRARLAPITYSTYRPVYKIADMTATQSDLKGVYVYRLLDCDKKVMMTNYY